MEAERSHSGGLGIVLLLIILGLAILLAMPTQLPTIEQVLPRSHAVERHGADAIVARESLLNCGSGLRVRLCPPSSIHGMSICFWCETGSGICPGTYSTIGGKEKTTFLRPCSDWRECR